MIADLDRETSLDPQRVGWKAATLAKARRRGLPVLPGVVVECSASRHHMEIGAAALPTRGSGGARLAVTSEPVPSPGSILSAAGNLSRALVARSSTVLEGGSEWAGAFTSYVGITAAELPAAVAGCWASAFSVDALRRQEAVGVIPGSFGMAVLIQPALEAEAGGVAELAADGSVVVHGVAGQPAPLLGGWVAGREAHRPAGEGWSGDLLDLVPGPNLDEIADALRHARDALGTDRCEWAVAGGTWILQLGRVPTPPPAAPMPRKLPVELVPTVRALMAAPGALGEELILPWGIAGLPAPARAPAVPAASVERARRLSWELVAEVWDLPTERALAKAEECLALLRSSEPASALRLIAGLRPADPGRAAELLATIDALRKTLHAAGVVSHPDTVWDLTTSDIERTLAGAAGRAVARVGTRPWEPLVAATVLAHGTRRRGIPASPGVGAGITSHVSRPADMEAAPPRSVVTASQAIPNLSQLLWDTAGLVTHGGSPAAHVFESARSLGVPAVCGVGLGEHIGHIVAVDGGTGVVAALSLHPVS